MNKFLLAILIICQIINYNYADDPDRLPTKCETCKYLANEISEGLLEKSSSDIIETGYSLDERLNKKNPKKYKDSELRLIEVLEDVCGRILHYKVHAERKGSLRYAKGESQTMQSLKDLRKRGVKVELGIPEDLWDVPSAEITNLKKYCDQMVETQEEAIETWFHNHTLRDSVPLVNYLCRQKTLVGDDTSCLDEVFSPEEEEERRKQERKEAEEAKKRQETKTDL